MRNEPESSFIEFGSNKCYVVYECDVISSPYHEKLSCGGLPFVDIVHGFDVGNFGLTVMSRNVTLTNEPVFQRELRWRDILLGRSTGIQVWRCSNKIRNIVFTFLGKRHNP